MEVQIILPPKAKVKRLVSAYPDLENDGDGRYFVGRSSDDPMTDDSGRKIEWLTHNEAVECCGFVEGLIDGAETMIEGNGGWAQGMISRKDFSGLAVSDAAKRDYKRISNRYWRAFRKGKAARLANKNK